ncbi:MAG: hypothetical protein IV107_25325, partial [Paucibacter sp.]|nr:hypothetical protein [Roseateles sp.]
MLTPKTPTTRTIPKNFKRSAALATSCLLAALLSAVTLSALAQNPTASSTTLSLEKVFRAESYRGENAKSPEFSRSGRYLAYLWNPFGEPGTDLYVHDSKTGKTQRLTSPALMAAFDAPEDLERFDKKLQQKRSELAIAQAKEEAQAAYLQGAAVDLGQWEAAAIERVKQDHAAKKLRDDAQKAADNAEAEIEKRAAEAFEAKRGGKSVAAAAAASAASAPADKPEKDKELWEWRDELKKKQAKDKLKPSDLYPGATQIVWANHKDELIFAYRGNLFRWVAGDSKITPLQSTSRALRMLAYAADDQAYVYMDDKRVLRSRFGAGGVQVLNRELIHPDDAEKKYQVESTTTSEDGRWMALVGRAPLKPVEEGKPAPEPSGRKVEIMNYGERFATAKKVDREVSDDKRTNKPLAIYIRKVPGLEEAPAKQAQPVFTHAGGDGWFELSPIAWARDGSRYAFSTWEREKELLRVYIGGADENGKDSAKPELVLERRGDVGHEVVSVIKPQ